jgi:argininosuccinate synthase
MEKAVSTGRQLRVKRFVDDEWTSLIYQGLWVDPVRADLDAFIDSVNLDVSGSVTVKLHRGCVHVVSRRSDTMIYDKALATYGKESTFNQNSSLGFIELWGLQSRVAHQRARGSEVS